MANLEKINPKEKLRTSYPKINAAIEAIGKADDNATQAKFNSEQALNTANKANSKADETQTQLNNLIIESGTSDAEVIQARGTAPVLNDRLNGFDAQFAEIAPFKLVADIPDTNYIIGNVIGGDYVRSLQIFQYGNFYRKLRKNESVQICCMGDSMTYGQDTTSADRRPPDPNLMPDGSAHTHDRASITYPEALQNYMREIYPNVTVITRARSGDWVRKGYQRFFPKHNSDLTVIMYGTNDSRATWVDADYRGNLKLFIQWYEQLIIREVLWGKGVIILTPPQLENDTDIDVDTYRNALVELGRKYCVPVIDAQEFTTNYLNDIYSDSVHFNGKGYSVFGSRVASLLYGEGCHKPYFIGAGSKILGNPTINNVAFNSNANYSATSNSNDPNDLVIKVNDGGEAIYTFYAEKEDIIFIPYLYLNAGVTFKYQIDFALDQAQNALDSAVGAPRGSETPTKSITIATGSVIDRDYCIENNLYLRLTQKGWHTIKITSTGGQSVFNGFEVLSFEDLENYKYRSEQTATESLNIKNGNTSVVNTWKISASKLFEKYYGSYSPVIQSYYAFPPFKIVVFNADKSILEYYLQIGRLNDGTNTRLVTTPKRTDLVPSPTNEVLIKSCSFDAANQQLVVTFNGVQGFFHAYIDIV